MKNKIEFNTQICTTIEQSKRLLKLGLKPETSDMLHYKSASMKIWGVLATPYSKEVNGLEKYYFPAWSLHRLMKIGNITGAGFLEIDNIYDVCIRLIAPKIKFKLINSEYING